MLVCTHTNIHTCLQKSKNFKIWKLKKNRIKTLKCKQKVEMWAGISGKVKWKAASTKEDTEGLHTKTERKIYEEDIKVIKLDAPGR